MRTPRVLYQMVRADFLERSRSYAFLILLCLSIYLGYAINTSRLVLRFNTCAEIFDSDWMDPHPFIRLYFPGTGRTQTETVYLNQDGVNI